MGQGKQTLSLPARPIYTTYAFQIYDRLLSTQHEPVEGSILADFDAVGNEEYEQASYSSLINPHVRNRRRYSQSVHTALSLVLLGFIILHLTHERL